ncbi:MAG: hypothetical protein JWO71_4270 [Candidatus Acidoferrum typicum]|nr:hypothetical protein [Candidatus Acidoferrum typicum]
MRFRKILFVCLGLTLFAGVSARQACSTAPAGKLLTKFPVVQSVAPQALSILWIADGGHPLPPPPPMVADGGHPLPPPPSVSSEFGIAV